MPESYGLFSDPVNTNYNLFNSGSVWVPYGGIFEKNTATGELRLKEIPRALAGVSREDFGKSVNGEWVPSNNIVFSDSSVLSNDEINQQLYKSFQGPSDPSLSWPQAELQRRGRDLAGSVASGLASLVFGTAATLEDTASGAVEGVNRVLGTDIPTPEELTKEVTGTSQKEYAASIKQELGKYSAYDPSSGGIFEAASEGRYVEALDKASLAGTAALADLALTRGAAKGTAVLAGVGQSTQAVNILTSALFAARTHESTYAQNRAGGADRLSAFGAANATAAATAWLEKSALDTLFSGKGVLTKIMAEGTQEAAQTNVEMFGGSAFDRNVDWNGEFLTDALYNSLDAFTVGGGVGGTVGMAQSFTAKSLYDKPKELRGNISVDKLSQDDQAAMMEDFGTLKIALESVYATNAEAFTPLQVSMLEKFNQRWGHIREVENALGRSIADALDPTKKGERSVERQASDFQVFDEAIERDGELITTDDTAASLSVIPVTVDDAWDLLKGQLPEYSKPKEFQLYANQKLDNLEFILETQGGLSLNELMEADQQLIELYTGGNATRLAPAQRKRLLSLYKRAATVTDDSGDAPEMKELYSTARMLMKQDIDEWAPKVAKEITGLAKNLSWEKVSEMDNLTILSAAKVAIDKIVTGFGTELPPPVKDMLNVTLDQLIDKFNSSVPTTDGELESKKNLDMAIRKIASVTDVDASRLAKLQPVPSKSFINEVRNAETNFRTELGNATLLGEAIEYALINAEKISNGEMPGLGVYQQDKAGLNQQVGIPGLSPESIMVMLKDKKMHDKLLSKLELVLSGQDMANMRSLLNSGGPLHRDFRTDWQMVRDKASEVSFSKTREWARNRASQLAAQGQGGEAVVAMQSFDEGVARKRKQQLFEQTNVNRSIKDRVWDSIKNVRNQIKLNNILINSAKGSEKQSLIEESRKLAKDAETLSGNLEALSQSKKDLEAFLDKLVEDGFNDFIEKTEGKTQAEIDNDDRISYEEGRDAITSVVEISVSNAMRAFTAGKDIETARHIFRDSVNRALARANVLKRKKIGGVDSLESFARVKGIDFSKMPEHTIALYDRHVKNVKAGKEEGILYVTHYPLTNNELKLLILTLAKRTPSDSPEFMFLRQLSPSFSESGVIDVADLSAAGKMLGKMSAGAIANRMPEGTNLTDDEIYARKVVSQMGIDGTNWTLDATHMSMAIDSIRANNMIRRLWTAAAKGKVDQASVLELTRRLSMPTGKESSWSEAHFKLLLGQFRSQISAFASENRLAPIVSQELVKSGGQRGTISTETHGVSNEGEAIEMFDSDGFQVADNPNAKIETGRTIGLNKLEREMKQWLNPENVVNNAMFPQSLRDMAKSLLLVSAARKRDALLLLDISKKAGYTFYDISPDVEEKIHSADPLTDRGVNEELQKVTRVFESARESMKNVFSPQSLSLFLIQRGYSHDEVHKTLTLVDMLATKYAATTGKPVQSFYERAVNFLMQGGSNPKAVGLTTVATQSISAARSAGIHVASKVKGDVTAIQAPIHEIIHSMEATGVLREMLTDSQADQLEKFLGGRIPRRQANGRLIPGAKLSTPQKESLVNAIMMTLAARQSEGKFGGAIRAIRESMLSYISSMTGHGLSPAISGIRILDGNVPQDLEDALMALFGAPESSKFLHFGDNQVTALFKAGMVGAAQRTLGLDITPVLRMTAGHHLTVATAMKFAERVTGKNFFNEDGTILDSVKDFDKWVKSVYGPNHDKVNSDVMGYLMKTHQDLIADLEKAGVGEDSFRQSADPRVYAKDIEGQGVVMMDRATMEVAKAEKHLAETFTPFENVKMDNLIHGIDAMLGLLKPNVFRVGQETDAKSVMDNSVKWLRTARNKWHELFDSKTYPMERMLKQLGITNEYMLAHNIGGIYSQANATMNEGVMVEENGIRRVINEPLAQVLGEIPDNQYHDVFRYLAAQRELELAKYNIKKSIEYRDKLLDWEANPVGPRPEEPNYKNISGRNQAVAEIVKTYMDMKWGPDAGSVGAFAKRVVKFANSAIVDRLHIYGFLTDQEKDSLLSSGEWWIPLVKINEIIKDSGAEPLFNDGTKEAMKALLSDLDEGIEHPISNIQKRVLASHLFMSRQRVRNALLNALTNNASGIPEDDESLKNLGLRRAYTTVQTAITEDEWRSLSPKERGILMGKVGVGSQGLIKNILEKDTLSESDKKVLARYAPTLTKIEQKPVARSSYHDWVSKNLADKDKVYALWNKGEASYFIVDDPELLAAMESIRPHEIPQTLKMLRGFLNFFGTITKTMAVSITHNPQFLLNMPFRDWQNALVKSQTGMSIFDFPRAFYDSLPALFPGLAKEFPNSFKLWNDRAMSLSAQTSLQSELVESSPQVKQSARHKTSPQGTPGPKRLARALAYGYNQIGVKNQEALRQKQETHGKSILDKIWYNTKTGAEWIWSTLSGVAGLADASFRMAERRLAKEGDTGTYTRLKQALKSKLSGSKEREEGIKFLYNDLYIDQLDRMLTLDFSRRGEFVSVISKLKMFAGPTFQDWNQTIGMLADKQRIKSVAMKGIAFYTLPAMVNMLRFHDDEDWQKMNYWDKFSYMHLSKNEDGTFNKIPWGIGMLSTVFKDFPIAAYQFMSNSDPLAFRELAHQVKNQTPLQWLPLVNQMDEFKDWFVNMMPTAAEPAAQIALNRDQFTGAPVDYDIDRANTLLPAERGKEKVGVIEYMLASHGVFGLSSRQWGHLTRKQFPGLIGDLYGAANQGLTEMYNKATSDNSVGADYDPIRKSVFNFKTGPVWGPASMPVNRLYDLHQSASQAMKTFVNEEMQGHKEKAANILRKHPEALFVNNLKSAYGQVMKLKIERSQFLKNGRDLDQELIKSMALEMFDKPMTIVANDAVNLVLQESKNNNSVGSKK